MKKAFLTGITGQDGSYLAELLLEKGYEVHAIIRRGSIFTTIRIDHIYNHKNLYTYHGDLSDSSNIHRLLLKIQPDEIYNLGAQSHVGVSFEVPEYTADVVGLGAIRLLDALRDLGPTCKYYQASTSELFGGIPGTEPQNEKTPFACNGILFNHESPRRGETFVTKKITKAAAQIYKGKQKVLKLGNLDAKRDWGYAKDFVYAQWLMLQQEQPKDYVIATGETHTVREFVEAAFAVVNISIIWEGRGVHEVGINSKSGETIVEIDELYFRPSEVELLLGDPSLAEKELGWKRTTSFEELVKGMVQYDLHNDGYGGSE
jgi:GDPmannose 4,6-dehydratase